MASFIVVYVENIIPDTDTTINVQYSWNSINGTDIASGGGNIIFSSSILSTVMNQNVIDQAVSDSNTANVSIGVLDRKILFHGLV